MNPNTAAIVILHILMLQPRHMDGDYHLAKVPELDSEHLVASWSHVAIDAIYEVGVPACQVVSGGQFIRRTTDAEGWVTSLHMSSDKVVRGPCWAPTLLRRYLDRVDVPTTQGTLGVGCAIA